MRQRKNKQERVKSKATEHTQKRIEKGYNDTIIVVISQLAIYKMRLYFLLLLGSSAAKSKTPAHAKIRQFICTIWCTLPTCIHIYTQRLCVCVCVCGSKTGLATTMLQQLCMYKYMWANPRLCMKPQRNLNGILVFVFAHLFAVTKAQMVCECALEWLFYDSAKLRFYFAAGT